MKKWYLSILLLGVLSSCSSGNDPDMMQHHEENFTESKSQYHISLYEALQNADDVFREVFHNGTRSARKVSTVENLESKNLTRGNEMEGFYIVNYTDGGFAILSSDKRREPVYAISDSGNLNLNDTTTNPGLSWYINDAIPTIDNSIAGVGIPEPDTIGTLASERYFKIKPKLTGFLTQFHQGTPYNKYCPNGCPAGCAPIAVGTICTYYEWPTSYGGYTFDWTDMKTNRSHDSWSRLFYMVGLPELLNTDYHTYGSGTSRFAYAGAFKKLGYKNPLQVIFNPALVWKQMSDKNIVMARGSRIVQSIPDLLEGHAWVLDGAYKKIYDYSNSGHSPIQGENIITKYYFNCIWGWDGSANGFYYYDNCLGGTPDTQTGSTGTAPTYDMNLEIVYNFEKI